MPTSPTLPPSLSLTTQLTPLLATTALLSLSITQYTTHSSLLHSLSTRDTSSSSPGSTPTPTRSPRTLSHLWRQIYPVTVGIDALLSITSFIGAIRLFRAHRLLSQRSDGVWWGTLVGAVLMGARVVSSWWMGTIAVRIAGAYERVGIWRWGVERSGRENVIEETEGQDGVEAEAEAEAEKVSAMEEGRYLNEVVDERVLEMERRWVRWCGFRGVGVDLLGMGLFGWVLVRGTR